MIQFSWFTTLKKDPFLPDKTGQADKTSCPAAGQANLEIKVPTKRNGEGKNS